ncbi:MAG: hypothetical protein A2Z83_08150 [Omnitrophica bacterium GWA2_52_8]|nr:MAG: hypothetical protein A2Z83_08150 [Omnitrophica bacterium GWA2_52_8]
MEQFGAQSLIYLSALFFSLSYGRDLCFSGLRDPFAKGWLSAIFLCSLLTLVSVLPVYSLITLGRLCSHWIVYRAALSVCSDSKRRNFLIWMIILAGIAYSVFGGLQLTGYFPSDYWYSKSSMASRYVNGGHFAAFLVAPIFLSLAAILNSRNYILKVFSFLCLMGLLAALVLTRSRTVWISVGFCFFIFLWSLARLKIIRKKPWFGLIFIFFILLAALWGSGYWIKILARFLEIWDGKHLNIFSLVHRFSFWQGSLHAIWARPWGWGFGTFVHIFPRFRTHSDRFLVDYAHNETLQIGVDLGAAGITLLFGVLWMVATSCLRAFKAPHTDVFSKIRLTGQLASFLCLFMASQFDFPMRIYATSLIAAIVLGIMAAEIVGMNGSRPAGDFTKGLRRIVLSGVLFFWFALSATQLYAQICYRTGIRQEKDFQWNEASAAYRHAILWGPWNGDFYEALGRLSLKRSKLSFQLDKKIEYRGQALQSFKRAAQLNRFWPASYFAVGTLMAQSNDPREAERYFEKAAELEPQNAFYLSHYAQQVLQNGDIGKACGLYEKYQKLAFREKGPSTEQILKLVYAHTQDPHELRRVVGTSWQEQYTYGRFMAENGNWAEATPVIQAALNEAQKEWEIGFFMDHLGAQTADLFEKNNELAEALAIYEAALAARADEPHWRAKADEIRGVLMSRRSEQGGTL